MKSEILSKISKSQLKIQRRKLLVSQHTRFEVSGKEGTILSPDKLLNSNVGDVLEFVRLNKQAYCVRDG